MNTDHDFLDMPSFDEICVDKESYHCMEPFMARFSYNVRFTIFSKIGSSVIIMHTDIPH